MDNNVPHARPPTPQALLHRAPDKPDPTRSSPPKPKKYIILLLAPASVAGKVQIARSVARALSCPLFQGDALHESNAKAAAVGASRNSSDDDDDRRGRGRYRRMWLSKMTRTGLLFPEESRPANGGFDRGSSSVSTSSRRGSASSSSSSSSVSSSTASLGGSAAGGSTASSSIVGGSGGGGRFGSFGGGGGAVASNQYVNQPVLTVSEEERRRKENPALMVLTHPELEAWHRDAIRRATGEYDIGVIFVPLYETDAGQGDVEEEEEEEEEDLPVLKPLDPRTIGQFASFDALRAVAGGGERGKKLKYGKGKEGNLEEEMVLTVDVRASVEEIIEKVVEGVKDVMGVDGLTLRD